MYHGKETKAKKKRKYAAGREPMHTTFGKEAKKKVKVRGGSEKTKLIASKYANVVLKTKAEKCEIVALTDNPANKDFTRRNVITKGAILTVKTPKGDEVSVRVTSRPGQEGTLNAVLL